VFLVRRVLRVLGWIAAVFVLFQVVTFPVVGPVLGWCLLMYVLVRAAPAVRSDVSRLLAGRFGSAVRRPVNEWRF
jgi:hypothetical protein